MTINYRVSTLEAQSLYNCILPVPIIICADKSLLSPANIKIYVLIAAEFFQAKKEQSIIESHISQTKNNISLINTSINLLEQLKHINNRYVHALNKLYSLEEKEIFVFEDKNKIE